MPRRRIEQAHALVAASGSQSGREQQSLDFLSSRRIRANIRAVLEEEESWLRPAYSLAMQAEHLLQVVEGKRTHHQPRCGYPRTRTACARCLYVEVGDDC